MKIKFKTKVLSAVVVMESYQKIYSDVQFNEFFFVKNI